MYLFKLQQLKHTQEVPEKYLIINGKLFGNFDLKIISTKTINPILQCFYDFTKGYIDINKTFFAAILLHKIKKMSSNGFNNQNFLKKSLGYLLNVPKTF